GDLAHADLRQVIPEKACSARHVGERELAAVPVLPVVERPDVPAVVEQRRDHAEPEHRCVELLQPDPPALVAVDQPRHGERYVEDVLKVVIRGVAGVVAGSPATVHGGEVAERPVDLLRRGGRVKLEEDPVHLRVHDVGIGGLDLGGYVVLVAAAVHGVGYRSRLWTYSTPR